MARNGRSAIGSGQSVRSCRWQRRGRRRGFQHPANGGFELDARYTLETGEGELIIVRNCGPFGALIPVFETKHDGLYSRLNQGDYLSSDPGIAVGAVNLTIYEKR